MKTPLILAGALALAVAVGLASTGWAKTPSSELSKALVMRFWTEVWNSPYRLETIDELLAEDFIITTDGKDIVGRPAFKQWLQAFQSKVEGLKVVPQEVLVTEDGSRVITRMVASGRNRGMFGTTPDGAPVEFVAISIMQVRNGKLTHNWVERSAYELHQRLTGSSSNR